MAQTVVEKIAQAHMAEGPRDRPVRSGDSLTIRPYRVMTHDNTAAMMKNFLGIGSAKIAEPRLPGRLGVCAGAVGVSAGDSACLRWCLMLTFPWMGLTGEQLPLYAGPYPSL